VFATKPSLRHLGGFGLSLSKETAGINSLYQSFRGHFSAAYNLPLDHQGSNLLAMGIQGGFVQKSLNDMALQWGSQYNPVIGFDPTLVPSLGELHNRIIYPTFSAGITWYHVQTGYQADKRTKSFIGFSVANFNRPDYSMFDEYVTRAPLIYSFQSGVSYKVQKRLTIAHTLLSIVSNRAYHFNFGTYVIYNVTSPYNRESISLNLLAGGWYRLGDAFVLSAGLQAKQITVAMSYDFNTGNAFDNTVKGGAYEVSLSYRITQKKSRRRYAIPLI
jgi:type IX secretion system PorP/SprF family membrane protein